MSSARTGGGASWRFWLEHRGHRLELRSGENLVGRSVECQLVLDDLLVSREHASITVSEQGAWIADRGSANGVFVNGERVTAAQRLEDGDRIDIGQQELVLHAVEASRSATAARVGDETLHGMSAPVIRAPLGGGAPGAVSPEPPRKASSESRPQGSESDSTTRANALDMLGGVADKALALGRGEAAEKMLAALLENVLEQVTTGREVDTPILEKAALYAVKLAAATEKGYWVDYAFGLYLHVRRPLPGEVVDQLHAVLRTVADVDLARLRSYLAVLAEELEGFSANERFLVQRIEGLERIAALK